MTVFPTSTVTPPVAPVIGQMTATSTSIQVFWSQLGNAQSPNWRLGHFVISCFDASGDVVYQKETNNTLMLSTCFFGLVPSSIYYVTVQYFIPALFVQSPVSDIGQITTMAMSNWTPPAWGDQWGDNWCGC